ncbi:hypothetical protein ACOMHN_014321 [Nucella lapillus]
MAVITTTSSEFISHSYDLKSDFITSYEEVVTAQSPLGCAIECSRRSDCHYCAYNSTTGQCYLHVLYEQSKEVKVNGVAVFADDLGAACDHGKAVNTSTTSVRWGRSGVEGALTCHEDYLYGGSTPTVVCTPPGLWTADGTCRQSVWRNPSPGGVEKSFMFDFPRVPVAGWAMCVRGTFCPACERTSFDFNTVDDGLVCHLDIRFHFDTMINKSLIMGNTITTVKYATSFPFGRGQSYQLEFRLLSITNLEVWVNGSSWLSYSPSKAFTNISRFLPLKDGNTVQFVDLGSGCQ